MTDTTEALRRQIGHMQRKINRQRQAGAQLNAANEKLRAEKSGLRFDLTKAKARIAQMEAQ